jgi:type IV secretory pathway VirB2 component (pilin)
VRDRSRFKPATSRPSARQISFLQEVLMSLRSRLIPSSRSVRRRVVALWTTLTLLLAFPAIGLAQSPWERAASNLEATFTGPLARSLALVAIVIGGLMFMFGEGGAKRQISGIVFGGGLALFAVQFLTWLF